MSPRGHAHHGRRGECRLFLSDQQLDFAFSAVSIRAVDGTPLSRYGDLRLFGASGKIVRSEYATIIQHPNGRQKHIASRNNRITVYPYDDDLADKDKAANFFLYYSTDTLRGSSGSPVFSDQWNVVALQRRGVVESVLPLQSCTTPMHAPGPGSPSAFLRLPHRLIAVAVWPDGETAGQSAGSFTAPAPDPWRFESHTTQYYVSPGRLKWSAWSSSTRGPVRGQRHWTP